MKKFLLPVLIMFAVLSVKAQNVYYDATTLKRSIKNGVVHMEIPPGLNEKARIKKSQANALTKKINDETSRLQGQRLRESDAQFKAVIDPLQKQLNGLNEEILALNNEMNIVADGRRDSVFTILLRYNLIDAADTVLSPAQLAEKVNQRVVFMFHITGAGVLHASGTAFNLSSIKSAVGSVGGLDVTNIANALADVMIEHAKQELTVAFFDRFRKFADDNPEFRILFPKTTRNLENLLSYKYPEMLPALRTAFLEDIRQVAFRLEDVIDLPRYKKLLRELPEVRIAIRSINIVHDLETGASNAADLIRDFSSFKEWNDNLPLQRASNVLRIATLFSEGIRYKDKGQVWVSGSDLKPVLMNDTTTRIFMELIYQKAKKDAIPFVKADGTVGLLSDQLATCKDRIVEVQDKLREFFILADRVNVSYREIEAKRTNHQSLSNDDYFTYINTSLDIVEYGFSWLTLFNEDPSRANDYILLLRESNDLYRSLYTKEFSQAVTLSMNILTHIQRIAEEKHMAVTVVDASNMTAGTATTMDLNGAAILKRSGDLFTVADKQNPNTILDTFTSLDRTVVVAGTNIFISATADPKSPLTGLFDFINKLTPYALFMANMVDAKSEAEVKNALDNVILPVGSSSIKKRSISNISVQSYLGATYNATSSSADIAWNRKWGITAPIGVALSWGGNGRFKQHGAFSLFAALLDIGAIVDYKLTVDNNTVDQDYQIKLGQIFSPGGYVVWGLPWGLPLSLGGGGQYGPGIFETNNGIQSVQPSWRLNFFIAVDIPLLTLHNRPRARNETMK
jgi:hypothetical protein